jgi:hypothetical protein
MLTIMGSAGNHAVQAREATHSSRRQDDSASERTNLIEALSDLHNLLEQYAPAWYTEEHHRKAESALHTGRGY